MSQEALHFLDAIAATIIRLMRKLVMKMSVSVDGFVGGPNGENDWIFKSSDESSRAWAVASSFEAMAPYWPTAVGPFAAPMNEIPKAVFTKQKEFKVLPSTSFAPATASWAEARIFDGDLAQEIKQLKQEPGKPILAIGGAGFMRSLIGTGLIDEYVLATHPVVLGAGQAIFNDLARPLDLKMIEAKAFPGGIVAHIYHPSKENL